MSRLVQQDLYISVKKMKAKRILAVGFVMLALLITITLVLLFNSSEMYSFAYISEGNVFVDKGGNVYQVTDDSSRNIRYGGISLESEYVLHYVRCINTDQSCSGYSFSLRDNSVNRIFRTANVSFDDFQLLNSDYYTWDLSESSLLAFMGTSLVRLDDNGMTLVQEWQSNPQESPVGVCDKLRSFPSGGIVFCKATGMFDSASSIVNEIYYLPETGNSHVMFGQSSPGTIKDFVVYKDVVYILSVEQEHQIVYQWIPTTNQSHLVYDLGSIKEGSYTEIGVSLSERYLQVIAKKGLQEKGQIRTVLDLETLAIKDMPAEDRGYDILSTRGLSAVDEVIFLSDRY